MTIQLLQTWAGKPAGIYTLDPGEESRLIGLGLARVYVVAMDGTAGDGAGEALIAASTLPIAAAAGAPVLAGMLLRDPATGLIYGQSDGAGGYAPLGGSGSGSTYLGQAASEAAMTALSAAVGSECTRSDIGTGGTRYELTALPATTAANWQPIQGVLADGSVVTLVLVDGKLPRRLRVSVASGCQVTVAVGGVTQPVLIETAAGQEHVVGIADDPGVAPPTTVTVQRTAGASSCWYSLEA